MSSSETSAYAHVVNSWVRVMRLEQFDPAQRWEDTGADSIATLHLLLELERAFGRKIMFDSLQPQLRAADIAALITGMPTAKNLNAPAVHLFPGLYGDDPRLANFRHAFADRLRFEVHELPDLSETAATLRDVQRTGVVAAQRINARQPSGPVWLAGFSFGGGVAFEAARWLTDAGRDVAFLGILDTSFFSQKPTMTWASIKRSVQLWVASNDRLRWTFLSLMRRTSPLTAHRFQRYMYGLFRERAIRRWRPMPLDINVFLTASAEYQHVTVPKWQSLCPRLQVEYFQCGHVHLFQSPVIETLAPAFEMRVLAAPNHAHSRVPCTFA